MPTRTCSKCGETKDEREFRRRPSRPSGRTSACSECLRKSDRERDAARRAPAAVPTAERWPHVAAFDTGDTESVGENPPEDPKVAAAAAAQAARIASDFDALKPEDFDVGNLNDGKTDAKASREKRQEYSRDMGRFMGALGEAGQAQAHGDGSVLDNMPADLGAFVAKVGEQERRFQNRRVARSLSLFAANEVLAIGLFKQAAEQYLRDKVTPTGYATKRRSTPAKRSVCLLLSDLHLGAELDSLDEPMPFRAVEEARRLEYVVRQALDYKPQYRDHSELVLLINGDIIEGALMHDMRSGAPLAEQKVIFWRYFRSIIGLCAQQYPSVRVFCQPGNHGRDLVRHAGRATARKWDGHEWEIYQGLMMMCSGLANVSWQIDFRAVSIVDLYGSALGLSHGDTEIKLGHPDTASAKNAAALDRINATRLYGIEFAAWAFGHFHTPRYHPRNPRVIYNGALVPPNGHARTSGYVGEPCGQWLWEAVEGYPIGDLRFVEVGPAQDHDQNLGTLVEPFRFSSEAA